MIFMVCLFVSVLEEWRSDMVDLVIELCVKICLFGEFEFVFVLVVIFVCKLLRLVKFFVLNLVWCWVLVIVVVIVFMEIMKIGNRIGVRDS